MRRMDAQDGEIGFRIIADQVGGHLPAVGERRLNFFGAMHDVAVRQQISVGRKNKTRAGGFPCRTFTAALRQKDAAYAVALAESLLSADPIMGRAAVASYDRAKAHAPDDDEGKMIEIVSKPK